MANERVALLFQTHFLDRATARFLRRLIRQAGPRIEVFVIANLRADEAPPSCLADFPHHVTRSEAIRIPDYPAKSFGPDWNLWHGGHSDLIALDFFRSYPDYGRYWVMEYDVRFSGDWGHFFSALEEVEADFLATTVRRREDHPEWCFWETLRGPEPLGRGEAIACFMPIHRASNAAMRVMDAAYRQGWTGHLEATWPTLVARAGLSVLDLGGSGPFTPAALRGRFYSHPPRDLYLAPGSFVFKPVMHRTGTAPDRLWHPVKPYRLRDEFRQGLRDVRTDLGRLHQRLRPAMISRQESS